MEVIAQRLEDIVATLRPLTVEWKDETAVRVIDILGAFPVKPDYSPEDVRLLLENYFDDGILISRLFLGLSKDNFSGILKEIRGEKGTGIQSFRKDPDGFVGDLLSTGLLDAMAEEANRKAHWSDVLVERLRSGRGSAISGQKRGRGVEEFAEAIVMKVFGDSFQVRCTFRGQRGSEAKCDIAIPTKASPRILIESKGYGATGSKMTDVLGDIRAIIAAKRPDTAFLFFTDGITWKQRISDLRKIMEFQNNGDISRIYTFAMAEQFEADLHRLKSEFKL
jgi:hypothetical protein